MQIRSLSDVGLEKIVACLLESFSDYFVKMPENISFWEGRFEGAGVDYSLSYGTFDEERLAAFMVHGIGTHRGLLSSYNAGTGVIPAYRGQKWVDEMYATALPDLKARQVQKCMLEVIQANHKAIRVYERIGFQICRSMKCFRGEAIKGLKPVFIQEISFESLLDNPNPHHHFYSWDNRNEAVLRSGARYECYLVFNEQDDAIGYFVINRESGYVAQLESPEGDYEALLSGIFQTAYSIRINNVDEKRGEMVDQLLALGLDNHVDQFEMEWMI